MPTVIKKLDAGSYQLKDQVVAINRVTKVVKGGKNPASGPDSSIPR